MEKTTVSHILTTGHLLELVPGESEFVCFKCTEAGTGHRYRCKNFGDLSLHRACAVPTITHTLLLVSGERPDLVCQQCSKIGTACGDFFLHGGCTYTKNVTGAEGEPNLLKREHKVYIDVTKYIPSLTDSSKALNLECIGASSTSKGGSWGIENTLNSSVYSKWWSIGNTDPSLPECLIYALQPCIVDEIRLQPAKCNSFSKLYPAKSVCFKIGCLKSFAGSVTSDEHYTWTYTSPVFPMAREDALQSFKLPSAVLCIGGVVKIELLGCVQEFPKDHLYYISICRVVMLGHPLSSEFSTELSVDEPKVISDLKSI